MNMLEYSGDRDVRHASLIMWTSFTVIKSPPFEGKLCVKGYKQVQGHDRWAEFTHSRAVNITCSRPQTSWVSPNMSLYGVVSFICGCMAFQIFAPHFKAKIMHEMENAALVTQKTGSCWSEGCPSCIKMKNIFVSLFLSSVAFWSSFWGTRSADLPFWNGCW